MPTYEYACTACGQHVEVFQRLSDDPLDTCGACGGPLRKVFHPAGILFKGSGFYSTDSRSKSKAAPSKDTGSVSKGDSSGSSETSKESKAEPKASDDAASTKEKSA